jgi:uncharacterized membrane protein (UPF0127 family)
MAKLMNQTQNKILLDKMEVANTLVSRMKGLIGKEKIESGYGLWIKKCNSIHTFLMSFPIDVIFVDKNLKVKKCIEQIEPNKIVWPIFGASSVIELKSGFLSEHKTQIGDQLHVDG